jgi:hypothetical protein
MRSIRFLRQFSATVVFSALFVGACTYSVHAAEVARQAFSKFKSAICVGSGSCSVDFGLVPANRRYEIRMVSCYLTIGNVNGKVLYWYLHANKGTQVLGRIHLRPQLLGTVPPSVTYNATEYGLLVVPQGGSMIVAMTRDSSTAGEVPGMDCTISGDNVVLR